MNPKLEALFARRSIRHISRGSWTTDWCEICWRLPWPPPRRRPWIPGSSSSCAERDLLTKIAAGLPNGGMLASASLGIVVCGDLRRAHDGQLSYLLQDCSAAIENLLLAASALGLGACWLGVHPREDRIAHLRSLLHIPPSIIPVSAIALGWPAETKPPRTRYREQAVHHETW